MDPIPPPLDALNRDFAPMIGRACSALDEGRPGMLPIVAAWRSGDAVAAARQLVGYLRTAPLPPLPPREVPAGDPRLHADRVMADLTPFFSSWDPVPRRADGGWDWHYDGTQGDREWGWLHNRHTNVAMLFHAWQATGDAAYARRIDSMLWDWVVSNPYPGMRSNSAPWRGLEVFCRATRWTAMVHAMRCANVLSDATLVAVMASLPEHADYARRFHARANNWLTMEMNGLATLGCAWPEFRDAPEWRTYAAATVGSEPDRQCYPDGAQKELTFHYHQVTEANLAAIARILEASGHGDALPDGYHAGIDRMWAATAAVVDQRGFGPVNNDSDLHQVAEPLRQRGLALGHADWIHIASAGREGVAPAGPPSRLLPWAGQLAMRSGWTAQDQWAWFDAGPWGSAHQHQDMLHLSVRHGRELLVDCGRYHYVRDAWRTFFCSTAAHNGLLVDGAGQQPGPVEALAPLADSDWAIRPAWDFCRGRFVSGFVGLPQSVTHARAVLYRRGAWWLVIDIVELDRPRVLTWHWHLHPDCTPAVTEHALCSVDPGQGNVRLLPLLPGSNGPCLCQGRTEPEPLGWFSPRYGDKGPTTTGVWTMAGTVGTIVQAWLITTAIGTAPQPAVIVQVQDGLLTGTIDGVAVCIPLRDGLPALSVA
jgi:hypothetical protein